MSLTETALLVLIAKATLFFPKLKTTLKTSNSFNTPRPFQDVILESYLDFGMFCDKKRYTRWDIYAGAVKNSSGIV